MRTVCQMTHSSTNGSVQSFIRAQDTSGPESPVSDIRERTCSSRWMAQGGFHVTMTDPEIRAAVQKFWGNSSQVFFNIVLTSISGCQIRLSLSENRKIVDFEYRTGINFSRPTGDNSRQSVSESAIGCC